MALRRETKREIAQRRAACRALSHWVSRVVPLWLTLSCDSAREVRLFPVTRCGWKSTVTLSQLIDAPHGPHHARAAPTARLHPRHCHVSRCSPAHRRNVVPVRGSWGNRGAGSRAQGVGSIGEGEKGERKVNRCRSFARFAALIGALRVGRLGIGADSFV